MCLREACHEAPDWPNTPDPGDQQIRQEAGPPGLDLDPTGLEEQLQKKRRPKRTAESSPEKLGRDSERQRPPLT